MNSYKNVDKYYYTLWLKIKCLNTILENIGGLFDISNGDEFNIELWEFIISKVEEVLNCISKENIIKFILDGEKGKNHKDKIIIWCYYEQLIENLTKLILSKDYNIIPDNDEFIKNINDELTFFEKKLKIRILEE